MVGGLDLLLHSFEGFTSDEVAEAIAGMSPQAVEALLESIPRPTDTVDAPRGPLQQARILDPGIRSLPHLEYLSQRLAKAVEDVENGIERRIIVGMPPRSGKSQLSSVGMPLWLLHKHPDWKIGLVSHSPLLAASWGRQIRRTVETDGHRLGGLGIARDAGAVAQWETTEGGSVMARSPGQTLAGYGFKVLLVDDPVRDFVGAHSETQRDALWDWWKANAVTRLEPPSLVIVVMTRWHEDDIVGRLLSPDFDGDPDEWEVISFPAIAEEHDVLGREPGQPLYSPLVEETEEQALARWAKLKTQVGSYVWSALYQQSPTPAKGEIFNVDWWRFWTRDPAKVGGNTVLLPEESLGQAKWIDSWDFTASDAASSDYVVGQRWCRLGPNRYLIAQQRGKWAFNDQLKRMQVWGISNDDARSPYGRLVHRRLVEKAANGAALIAVLEKEISGIKAVSPRTSKENRARAVTPEIESGHVYLPHPGDPGNEWVSDFLAEFQAFPNGKNDDQVDGLTQALFDLRDPPGSGGVQVPGRGRRADLNVAQTVKTGLRRISK